MQFRLNRGVVRLFRRFPSEEQNEGHAEHAAMLPAERLALAGVILRRYVSGILNLPEFPRMDRTAVRVVPRGAPDE